jgi:8-oxo-dGTP diphosphatase
MPGNPFESEIAQKYGNRARIRACGLCWKGVQLLMVNHNYLTSGDFWAPPGGGIEFGQPALEALIREFKEETTIKVSVGSLLFTCEYIKPPLHSIELFFEVFPIGGEPNVGSDPESPGSHQIIKAVEYLNYETIIKIPVNERHGIFRFAKTADELRKLTGFYRLWP